MAFRLPQAAPQRHVPQPQRPQISRPASLHQPLDQSQEWVLFSPSTYSHTLSPTEVTPRTGAASRYSDLISLHSILPPSQEGAEQEGEQAAGDNDDLDSLDDGLHEFRAPSHVPSTHRHDASGAIILPQHDGLGSFHASSQTVQEQIWQHERFNPRRRPILLHRTSSGSHHRRLETIEDDQFEKEHPFMEGEKLDRVERWRLDQSRVMLDEVQKETRRRRRLSLASSPPQAKPASDEAESLAALTEPPSPKTRESESFWERITRRVIKDFMGIDDSMLSIILGESLPGDDLFSTTPKSITTESLSKKLEGVEKEHLATGWEDRLLTRLAKELSTIVNNLSDQPSTNTDTGTGTAAFSTYTRSETFDYAGIPIKNRTHPTIPEAEELDLGTTPKASDPIASDLFSPTLAKAQETSEATEHEAGWGIEDSNPAEGAFGPNDIEYWERTPDLKQVFAYLSRRFLKRGDGSLPPPASISEMASSSHSTATAVTASVATTRASRSIAIQSTPDSLRRAAIIRQHHPLVSRAHEVRLAKQRRSQHQRRPSLRSIAERMSATDLDRPAVAASESGVPAAAAVAVAVPADLRSLKRVGDDCASQSTKRSRTSRSRKHYWEVGSDSAAAALGGMGAWGEV